MKHYIRIKNENNVNGAIIPSGSKNSSLAIIVAATIFKGLITLKNIPRIEDVNNLINILNKEGISTAFKGNELKIDSSSFSYSSCSMEEVKSLRASYYLIGGFLPRVQEMVFYTPGGCAFQERPIDLHIDFFKQFGRVEQNESSFYFKMEKKEAIDYSFKRKSLGASVNALLFLIQIKGKSVLRNVSSEPELDDLIKFLNSIGGITYRKGNDLYIQGGEIFHSSVYSIMPDRIEIGSYALLGAMKGRVIIPSCKKEDNIYLFELFEKLGVKYSYNSSILCVEKSNISEDIEVVCDDYPSFPTDLKPILTLLLAFNKGESSIIDNIYNDRNEYCYELMKLGINIELDKNKVIVHNFCPRDYVELVASDLRGAFALLAGLSYSKDSKLYHYNHLFRGYENLFLKLKQMNIEVEEK